MCTINLLETFVLRMCRRSQAENENGQPDSTTSTDSHTDARGRVRHGFPRRFVRLGSTGMQWLIDTPTVLYHLRSAQTDAGCITDQRDYMSGFYKWKREL